MLKVAGVVKAYGPKRALDGVDLAVGAAEFVALLGPNGAGKTTLFQLLSGLFTADAGRLEVDGHDMARDPVPALAELGIVFQQPTLDLDLSPRQNLEFAAALAGLPRPYRETRIAAALAAQGLADMADQPVRSLSGGNRRRVELARAFLHEPKVLLLDEPTVGLDPASRRALLGAARRRCREQGTAVLWATHLVDEAEGADRLVVLHHGRIRFDGPPAGLVAQAKAATLADAFIAMTAAA
jgi:ABC-2 type transport system ATP-binding protein